MDKEEQKGLLAKVLADVAEVQQGQNVINIPVGDYLVGTNGQGVKVGSSDMLSSLSYTPGTKNIAYNNRGLNASYNPNDKLTLSYGDEDSGATYNSGAKDISYHNNGLNMNYNPYDKLNINYVQPNGVFYGITNGGNDLSIGRNTDTTNANISYNRPNQSVWFNFNKKF